MTLTEQELRWAQKDIYNAGQSICSAGLRLAGTEYEADYRRLYDAMQTLNRKLIADINKGKR